MFVWANGDDVTPHETGPESELDAGFGFGSGAEAMSA
jgi:hypothetical protein